MVLHRRMTMHSVSDFYVYNYVKVTLKSERRRKLICELHFLLLALCYAFPLPQEQGGTPLSCLPHFIKLVSLVGWNFVCF